MEKRILDIKVNLRQPWLLSILFAVSIPIFPEYIAPFLAIASLTAACVDARSRKAGLQIGQLGKLLLLYVVYMATGLLYTQRFLSTLATTVMWMVMLCIGLAMAVVLSDRRRLDAALFCLCLIAGVVGLIGTVQYALFGLFGVGSGMQFWGFIDEVVYKALPMELMPFEVTMRPSSTFNNPNIYAEYLVMMIPFVAHYAFSGRRTGTRVLCCGCFLLATAGVLFSFSRGSYIALLMVLLVFCLANLRRILVIIMGVVSVSLFLPEMVIQRFFSVSTQDSSIMERKSIWLVGLEQVERSPLFGAGAGVANTWDILLGSGINAPHMHNLVLQLMAEGGAIALGLMIALGWMLLRTGYAMLHEHGGEARAIGTALLGFVAAFCTHGMVDFPLMTPKLVGVFILVIAIGDAAAALYLDCPTQDLTSLIPVRTHLEAGHLAEPAHSSESETLGPRGDA